MAWEFDLKSPIFKQIIEKITYRIIKGEYKCGEKLASVRELAVEAGVNPNTVQRALSEIENAGLVATLRGDGRYITEDKALIEKFRKRFIEQNTAEFLEKMRDLDFSKEEIMDIISRINL